VLYSHVREDKSKGSGADPLNRESDLRVLAGHILRTAEHIEQDD